MVKKIRKKGARRLRAPRGVQTPGRGGGGPHGQKTRWLKGLRPGWRVPVDGVTITIGTQQHVGRLSERYAWAADKYEEFITEVTGLGAVELRYLFKGVPNHAGGGGHDIGVTVNGYYSGNHSSGHAPKWQIYDWVGTGWDDITGMVFATGGSEYEKLVGRVPYASKYFEAGTDNVQVRLLHPVVGGNEQHEVHVNQINLAVHGTTTTTTTTSTTTTAP